MACLNCTSCMYWALAAVLSHAISCKPTSLTGSLLRQRQHPQDTVANHCTMTPCASFTDRRSYETADIGSKRNFAAKAGNSITIERVVLDHSTVATH